MAETSIDIGRSLAGMTALDFGQGLAAAQVTKLLAELGVAVTRYEPLGGDPFRAHYPAYDAWHRRARIERIAAPGAADSAADLCIIGGEDFPGQIWRPDPAQLLARHPDMVILVIEAYPPDHPLHGSPAVEILAQATSGLANELSERGPVHLAFAPAGHCAALNGLTALLGALCERARGGAGRIVRTSLYEGAMTLGAPQWMRAENPVGAFGFSIPKDPRQLIFADRNGKYLQIVLGSAGSKYTVYRILGIDDPSVSPTDSGVPTGRGEPRNFFGDVDLLGRHVAEFDRDELLELLNQAGIPCGAVLAPGECWDDPQVAHMAAIATGGEGVAHVGLPMRGTLTEASIGGKLTPTVPAGSLPLAGVRILDYGIFVAGPYAGVALADLGADVIKIETPQGDPNRNLPRSYASANRGKRAITLDLKTPEGQAISRRLIDDADVVMSNFRPGVSRRLGVDPATLHAVNPDLVVIEATGFGRTGPYGDRPGFDMIFQAFCGHDVRAGGVGNDPVWDRTIMIDYVLGQIDQVAILVALWRRLRGAGGADLDVALLDAGLFLMSELVRGADGAFTGAAINNADRTGYHPAEAFYRCRDGWIAVAARGAAMGDALIGAMGITAPPLADWGEPERAALAAAFGGFDMATALARLAAAGVWAAPCTTSGEAALFDGAGAATRLVLATANPVYGRVEQVGALFRLGDARHTAPLGAPMPGEHSHAILAELGFKPDEIADLIERKVVA